GAPSSAPSACSPCPRSARCSGWWSSAWCSRCAPPPVARPPWPRTDPSAAARGDVLGDLLADLLRDRLGQRDVQLRDAALGVGGAAERERAPADVDVGVVVALLGDRRHAV